MTWNHGTFSVKALRAHACPNTSAFSWLPLTCRLLVAHGLGDIVDRGIGTDNLCPHLLQDVPSLDTATRDDLLEDVRATCPTTFVAVFCNVLYHSVMGTLGPTRTMFFRFPRCPGYGASTAKRLSRQNPMRWQPPSSTTLCPLQQVTAVAQSGTPSAARKTHSRPVVFPLGPPWFPCRLGVCRASSMYSLAGPCCSCIRRLWRCHCFPSAMEHAANSKCRSRKMPMNSVPAPLRRTGHATFRPEFRQRCCWPTQPCSLPD